MPPRTWQCQPEFFGLFTSAIKRKKHLFRSTISFLIRLVVPTITSQPLMKTSGQLKLRLTMMSCGNEAVETELFL